MSRFQTFLWIVLFAALTSMSLTMAAIMRRLAALSTEKPTSIEEIHRTFQQECWGFEYHRDGTKIE